MVSVNEQDRLMTSASRCDYSSQDDHLQTTILCLELVKQLALEHNLCLRRLAACCGVMGARMERVNRGFFHSSAVCLKKDIQDQCLLLLSDK